MDLQAELKRQLASLDLAIDDNAAARLIRLQEELLRWNRTYNLTAITEPLEVIEKHLVDSLTLLPYIGNSATLLDIGSGAGFPALPLKIMRPDLNVVSVDAVAKKIRFQKHVARTLGLDGFHSWHGRVEDLPQHYPLAGGFDLVVARAFSAIEKLIELALPCLAPAGEIVAMKGSEGENELQAAADCLEKNGLVCRRQVRLQLPVTGSERQLLFLGR